MKRKLVLGLILIFMLSACALFQGTTTNTETIVIGYESLAFVAFPTVQAYLAQREANGSLSGQALLDAKAGYAKARANFLLAGDYLKTSIQTPDQNTMLLFTQLLRAVAVSLADLSGGKVQGNNLTLPVVGGSK